MKGFWVGMVWIGKEIRGEALKSFKIIKMEILRVSRINESKLKDAYFYVNFGVFKLYLVFLIYGTERWLM